MELDGAFYETADFEITNKKLGEGSFGEVFVVKNRKNNVHYAVKIINPSSLNSGKDQMNLMRESLILNKLDHPAIVKFYGINFHSFEDPEKLEPTILTEYIPHGSLKEILDKEKRSIADSDWTPTKKYICLLGISDAMRYLHEQSILHRDLKPQNVLIDAYYYPRVCDFGLSRCFNKDNTQSVKMTHNIGTPLYTAPEILNDTHDEYGPEVDVYSFAILAYEIVTGIEPFSENGKSISYFKLMKKLNLGQRPPFPPQTNSKMEKLIKKCWNEEPTERPTFKEIFELLSTDFSYFDEDIDEDEIENYLKDLQESSSAVTKISKSEKEDQNKIQEQEQEQGQLIKIPINLLCDISKYIQLDLLNSDFLTNIYKAKKEDDDKFYSITYFDMKEAEDKVLIQKVFLNTLGIQSSLNHIAISPIIGFSLPSNQDNSYYTIINNFLPNNLENYIHNTKESNIMKLSLRKSILLFGIAAGLAYIHQNDIVHGDLKPKNIYFDDNFYPKINGFYFATKLKYGSKLNDFDIRGTPLYLPPEVLCGEFSHKFDIYTFAITAFQILTFREPYKFKGLINFHKSVKEGLRPELNKKDCSNKMRELIIRCWDAVPNKRPSFAEIVNDFMKYRDDYFDLTGKQKDDFDAYVKLAIKNLNLNI